MLLLSTETILRVSEEFDLDALLFTMKRIKAEAGEGLAEGLIKGLIATLEELKLRIILLQNEIFD